MADRAMVLSKFKLQKAADSVSLVDLMDRSLASGTEDPDSAEWKLREVLFLFWTLSAKGWVVKSFTYLFAFVLGALAVMYVAQPAKGISLTRVSEGLSVVFLGCGLFLAALSIMKAYGSIHTLPLEALKEKRAWQLILFAW